MRAAERLRRRQEFDAVFAEGVRLSGGPLQLQAAVQTAVQAAAREGAVEKQPCRFGFLISRRQGNAVRRNRLRRRLRHAAREASRAGGCVGLDVVVIARGNAGEASFQELDGHLRRLLGRAQRRLLPQAAAEERA